MKTYFIRCSIRVNTQTAEGAVKVAAKLLQQDPERFITAVPAERHIKLWKLLLTGH